MPIKTEYSTEQQIRDIPMTGLIPYSVVIEETYRLLKEKSLVLAGTSFKPNANGDTVTGIFIIHPRTTALIDPDLSMCITWTHSYHKAVRFQCNTSAITTEGILVVRDPTAIVKSRRSSNPAKYMNEIFEDLKLEINFIESSFNKLVDFKEDLKKTKANVGAASVSLGLLYCEEDVLTTSQASVIKEQILSTPIEDGWSMYQCFGEGLKDSHPKLFLSDHIKVFGFFEEVFSSEITDSQPERLSLPMKLSGKTVNEEIKEEYNYVSELPSVTFL